MAMENGFAIDWGPFSLYRSPKYKEAMKREEEKKKLEKELAAGAAGKPAIPGAPTQTPRDDGMSIRSLLEKAIGGDPNFGQPGQQAAARNAASLGAKPEVAAEDMDSEDGPSARVCQSCGRPL